MKSRPNRKYKWILISVLLSNLICFYPADMGSLPLLIFETSIINNTFSLDFGMEEIGSKFIFLGQLTLISSLFIKNTSRLLAFGKISIFMLFIGTPMIMDYRNVSNWNFEFSTWLPLYITGILFFYSSYSKGSKTNE